MITAAEARELSESNCNLSRLLSTLDRNIREASLVGHSSLNPISVHYLESQGCLGLITVLQDLGFKVDMLCNRYLRISWMEE